MDKAHRLTDKRIQAIERHLNGLYSSEYKRMFKGLKPFVDGIKKQSAELLNKINAAETVKEIQDGKSEYIKFYKSLIKSKEFRKLQNAISDSLYKLNVQASQYADKYSAEIYALNYNYLGNGLNNDLNGYKFKRVSVEDVEKYGELTRQTVDKAKDTKWNDKNFSKSVIVGAGLLLASDKILNRALKNTVNKNLTSAKMQTSGIISDAESKGRFDSILRANDEGFNVRKTWKAIHDNRTRDSHIELDGTIIPIDREFLPGLSRPRDPSGAAAEICNCRCELGYDVGQEKGKTRTYREGEVTGSYKKSSSFRGTTTEVGENMTYKEWMKWRTK